MIISAKWTSAGQDNIRVMLGDNDQPIFVPDNMENRHRLLVAEWEADGNVIAPPDPVVPEKLPITIADVIAELAVGDPGIIARLEIRRDNRDS